MMLDEPYRFAEAVSNRRDYIEDQLRGGSPVVGLTYADGILFLTLGRGQQKIYETYDRIAMGSVGHPTDIEKLRQAAVDLASVVGFNYSDADVTLQQIVHFGLGTGKACHGNRNLTLSNGDRCVFVAKTRQLKTG